VGSICAELAKLAEWFETGWLKVVVHDGDNSSKSHAVRLMLYDGS
jgi:hypothetical protein